MNSGCSALFNGNFTDPRIIPDDQFTGTESTRLEIIGVDWKQPPAADVLAHDSDGSGVSKLDLETSLKLGGDRDPHAIRLRIDRPVP